MVGCSRQRRRHKNARAFPPRSPACDWAIDLSRGNAIPLGIKSPDSSFVSGGVFFCEEHSKPYALGVIPSTGSVTPRPHVFPTRSSKPNEPNIKYHYTSAREQSSSYK